MNTLLIVALVMIGLAFVAWLVWPRIQRWFGDSETLFFARLQMAVGGIWAALVATDLVPFLNALAGYDPALGKAIPLMLFAWGIITEAARRSRATDLK